MNHQKFCGTTAPPPFLVVVLLMLHVLGTAVVVRASAAAAMDSLQGKIASRTLALAQKLQDAPLENRRRNLMIRESLRSHPRPKLLPGEGVISEEEEKKRMQAAQENQDDEDAKCDTAFFKCLSSSPCFDCFTEMKEKDVDWTGVSQDTKCETVTDSLAKAGLCASLGTGEDRTLFCDAFQACIYFDDNDDDQYDDDYWMDCSALTECNWPGIHASFVGDGVCHDNYGNSCYNSAICDYDGGDCCEDTCHSDPGAYLQCGSDGYACRNPNSTHCDPTLSVLCPPSKKGSNNDDKKRPECTSEETLYRLEMFDSFGDGWEDTTITITSKTGGTKPIFTGGLESGAQGTVYLCLSINPTCYDVEVGGGMWGREASWNIRGFAEGSPSVASGGGSMNCEFSVAGSCTSTCQGQSNVDPSSDADYKAFKDLFQCIDEKCMIQADACRADEACGKCFTQDVPQYCFSMQSFNAVTDCSVCKCIEGYDVTEYCSQKAAPGVIPVKPANGGQAIEPAQCTPAQKLDGSAALMEFMSCMHGRKEAIMVDDFDENNFGDLDTFEACAHAFADQDNHGGHTALSCVQILVNAINEETRPGEPTEAISQLASLLYKEGQTFCDCAKKASDECPLCPSFYNFKTLLYESLDACEALDEIDCDAWDEFQSPCQTNLINRFGSVNLSVQEQCDFMVANCGGAGPFPSFRRLDCRDELSAGSWDFYNQYARSCAGDDSSPVAPAPGSTPAPVSPPVTPPVPAPTPDVTPKSPTNQSPPTNKKPYVPPEDRGKPSYKSPDEDNKGKSHWFRNLVLIGLAGGVAYYIYKRQSEFNFVRYRRIGGGFGFRGGGYNADDSDMYSGLALESSTNFEPPTLPPTPMSMPNNGGYGA